VKFKHSVQDDIVVLNLSGKVMGGPDYEKFHGAIKELLEQGHRKYLLDLSGVDWINSTGIGILVSGYHSIKAAEGVMVICGANKRVRGIYYVSQLDKIFDAYETSAEALASLAGN